VTTPDLHDRAVRLGLYGLLAHWDEVQGQPWLPDLLRWEETERARRSLERRVQRSRVGRFKALADYDWDWPEAIDRAHIQELFELAWVPEARNVVLVGPNGVGKSMLAKNLAHAAVLAGHTARWTTASQLLNDLAAQDGAMALQRRLKHYCRDRVLCIDELGYLSYDNRHADLLFEVFPSATCVVTLVDRLVHRSEIVTIAGDSYRLREAQRAAANRAKNRTARKRATDSGDDPR
jgi:DNA replication protein DnaC